MTDQLALILERVSPSPRHLVTPVPSDEQLAMLMRAAAAAPDHKGLKPVRFIRIPDARRADLADAFKAAKRERDPGASDDEIARAGGKAFNGPLLLAVVLRIVRDHPRVSVSDQMLSAGAAIENVLLAASALGFAGTLRSGQSATSRRVRAALRLASDEDLAAFLVLGTLSGPAPTKPRDASGLLSDWA